MNDSGQQTAVESDAELDSDEDGDFTHWNNRVIEFVEPSTGEPWFQIHEVYYNGDKPVAYAEGAAAVCGDTVEEMRQTLARMSRCLDQPALREIDFSKGSTAT